ncbi:unnamed protein product [Trichogramma brassicae]|uniref:Peptidase A2 domain-containing protein n=1 Tax=Trichogramma brassicae TaxID=86971 RepID=A0A6H5I533_9HYME|nr:unnamed protein product [Trichogramma brassicae]
MYDRWKVYIHPPTVSAKFKFVRHHVSPLRWIFVPPSFSKSDHQSNGDVDCSLATTRATIVDEIFSSAEFKRARQRFVLVSSELRDERAQMQSTVLVRASCVDGEIGKLDPPVTSWASDTGASLVENRLYVYDRDARIVFLVDSGSVVSLLPRKFIVDKLERHEIVLNAANLTPIATYGITSISLHLATGQRYSGQFVIADVDAAIMGADFLAGHGLLVDLRGRRLIDSLRNISIDEYIGNALYLIIYNNSE